MRLTLAWFGYEIDFSFGPTTVDEPDTCSLDGGTTSSYPVGFTQTPHPPWERPLNTWDVPDEGED